MTDIQKLKALAEESIKGGENWIAAGMLRQLFSSSATPELVLELIAEVERMRSIESFEDAVACVFDNLKYSAANTDDKTWDERLEDLAEDVIEYAPRYKKQWKDIIKLSREKDQLKSENELLRKDAERYRFLRKTECWEDACCYPDAIVSSREETCNASGVDLDEAVDAAMAREQSHD